MIHYKTTRVLYIMLKLNISYVNALALTLKSKLGEKNE